MKSQFSRLSLILFLFGISFFTQNANLGLTVVEDKVKPNIISNSSTTSLKSQDTNQEIPLCQFNDADTTYLSQQIQQDQCFDSFHEQQDSSIQGQPQTSSNNHCSEQQHLAISTEINQNTTNISLGSSSSTAPDQDSISDELTSKRIKTHKTELSMMETLWVSVQQSQHILDQVQKHYRLVLL